jgi:hypothetical protein
MNGSSGAKIHRYKALRKTPAGGIASGSARATCDKSDLMPEIDDIKIDKEDLVVEGRILNFVFYIEFFYAIKVQYTYDGELYSNNCDFPNSYLSGEEAHAWWLTYVADCDPDHIDWVKVYYY